MFSKFEPLVSIIMPIYNTEQFLTDAVNSVLAQSYNKWELILLNDESPGNACSIVSQFTDSRIRYLEHSNLGPAGTRNRGITESSGAFVAFLDSDDTWRSDKLMKQVALFEKNPEVGVVYSRLETINEYGAVIPGSHPKLYNGFVLDRLWSDNFICCSSAVIRREVIDKIGYFDESLRMSEDFDFWLRVACEYRFEYVNEPLVRYRIHSQQASKNTDTRIKICLRIRERFEIKYGKKLSNKARCMANAYLISNKASRNFGKVAILETISDYMRSIAWYPFQGSSWFGLIKIFMPKFIFNFLRDLKNRLFR